MAARQRLKPAEFRLVLLIFNEYGLVVIMIFVNLEEETLSPVRQRDLWNAAKTIRASLRQANKRLQCGAATNRAPFKK